MANFRFSGEASQKKDIRFTEKIWKFICRPKFERGLGFQSFVNFNQVLLGKQARRLLMFPNLLVSKVKSAFLEASLGNSPSLTG